VLKMVSTRKGEGSDSIFGETGPEPDKEPPGGPNFEKTGTSGVKGRRIGSDQGLFISLRIMEGPPRKQVHFLKETCWIGSKVN